MASPNHTHTEDQKRKTEQTFLSVKPKKWPLITLVEQYHLQIQPHFEISYHFSPARMNIEQLPLNTSIEFPFPENGSIFHF